MTATDRQRIREAAKRAVDLPHWKRQLGRFTMVASISDVITDVSAEFGELIAAIRLEMQPNAVKAAREAFTLILTRHDGVVRLVDDRSW